jgi:hypothetical protein
VVQASVALGPEHRLDVEAIALRCGGGEWPRVGVPYLVSLLCEGGVTSGNSYNRMSAPTALGPEHLPDVEALAEGEGGEGGGVYRTLYPCSVRGESPVATPITG